MTPEHDKPTHEMGHSEALVYVQRLRTENANLIAQVEAQASEREKMLNIIASAYQIVGKHDAPARVLDVLADPLAATEEQVEAMLPYQVEALTVPQGWKLVPMEPTVDMISSQGWGPDEQLGLIYKAMLEVSPSAPTIPAIPGTKEGA